MKNVDMNLNVCSTSVYNAKLVSILKYSIVYYYTTVVRYKSMK